MLWALGHDKNDCLVNGSAHRKRSEFHEERACANDTGCGLFFNSIGVDYRGAFTDRLKTGCPSNGPSTCGFDFPNLWRWCRRGGPYLYENIPLAWMYYDVRRGIVKVDNEQDMTDFTNKYP